MTGKLYGVGLGPGDPELMSVKAHRLVRETRHVAYFRKKGLPGRARTIVEGMLCDQVVHLAMEYPVTTEIPVSDPRYNEVLAAFYGDCTARLEETVRSGEDVAVLCEGDPFFYGSFMHVYSRLKDRVPIEVVPAITGMSAAWTATGTPITWGDDILSVVMGTLDEETLTRAMTQADALVVMKIGRNLPKVRRALQAANKAEQAILVQYASMDDQQVCRLSDYADKTLPYFSIVIVHGQGRRP